MVKFNLPISRSITPEVIYECHHQAKKVARGFSRTVSPYSHKYIFIEKEKKWIWE